MKILVEDRINEISAENLSTYLGALSEHKPELMLNDYPTAQWISGMPESYEVILDSSGNDSGRKRISATIEATGVSSLNGIYLGNFNGDAINYEVFQEVTNPTVSSINHNNSHYENVGSAIVPIRVFNSFGHFVRGKPESYVDYLYTLKELGFPNEYLYHNFLLKITMQAEINGLISNDVSFQIGTVIRVSYTDSPAAGETRKYWKISGNLTSGSGEILDTESTKFAEKIHVGMTLLLQLDNDPRLDDATLNSSRLAQITEIRGDGSGVNAVTVIIRDYEDSSHEESIETILNNESVQFATVQIQGVAEEKGEWTKSADVAYLFTSLRVGLLRAGYVEHFPNPQVGLSRTYKDYSIRKSLINGGHQYLNRNIAKIYSGRLVLDRDRVRRFLTFTENQRAKPFPVEIMSDFEEETPTVFYGFFSSSPSENLSQRTGKIRDIDFSIQQVF